MAFQATASIMQYTLINPFRIKYISLTTLLRPLDFIFTRMPNTPIINILRMPVIKTTKRNRL